MSRFYLVNLMFSLMILICHSAQADSGNDSSTLKKNYQKIVKQNPESDFEWALESVKLKDIEYMTDRFGFPSRSFDAPTRNRIFEYDFSKAKNKDDLLPMLAGVADLAGGSGMFSTTLKALENIPRNCKFWFEVNEEDIIRKWRYIGKDCESIYQTIKTSLTSKAPTTVDTTKNRVSLGIMIQRITPDLQQAFHLSSGRGALVGDVLEGSPAYSSGVKRGDVIINIGGREINKMDELPGLVASFKPGDEVDIIYIRDGEKDKVTIQFDK